MSQTRPNTVRQIVAEMVIGVAACAGVYLLGVDPAERKLSQVREQIQTLREEIARAQSFTGTPEDAEASLQKAREFAAQVARGSRMACSETDMIETIAALARRHGVRIDDLRPANPRQAARLNTEAKPSPGDRYVAYAFSMTGDFARAAKVLDEAQREMGFAIVQSVKVLPVEGDGETTVRVTVQTEHRAFDTSALVAAGAFGTAGGAP